MEIVRNTTIQDLIDFNIISIRTYTALKKLNFNTVGEIADEMKKAPTTFVKVPNFGAVSQRQVYDVIGKMTKSEDTVKSIDKRKEYTSFLHRYFQKTYDDLCEDGLNTRAKNLKMKYFPRFEDAVLFSNGVCNKENARVRNIGKKSVSMVELRMVFQKFEDIYKQASKLKENDGRYLLLKNSYPFLSDDQCHNISGYYNSHKHYPVFYLLCEYMQRTEEPKVKAYSLVSGVRDGKRWTVKDTCKLFGVSKEWIRQIRMKDIYRDKLGGICEFNKTCYQELFNLPYVSRESEAYKAIKVDESLNCDFDAFAVMLGLLCHDFCVKKIKDDMVALRKTSLDETTIENLIKRCESVLTEKCYVDKKVRVKDLIGQPYDDFNDEAKQIVMFVISKILKTELEPLDNKEYIIVRHKYFDVSAALCDILRINCCPMHLEDLFNEFKWKYPEHKYTSADQLRTVLNSNPAIKAVGMRSTFSLSEWDNVYCGTIRDIIIDTLKDSPKPVHISELLNKAKTYYPHTYTRSIKNTMIRDLKHRFVHFENGYYGLTTKEYPSSYHEMKRVVTTVDIKDKILMFKDFVDEHHCYPTSSKDKKENSLKKWFEAVTNGWIKVKEKQYDEFMSVLKSYEKDFIPRNACEKIFYMKCNEYKKFVDDNNAHPNRKKSFNLCDWMKRTKSRYDTLTDFRKKYFDELLKYLSSKGLPL